jgi:hypothetical protein
VALGFSLPQFEPNLGSLESVTIDVNASLSGTESAFSPTNDGGDWLLQFLVFDSTGQGGPVEGSSGVVIPDGPIHAWSQALTFAYTPFSALSYIGTGQIAFDVMVDVNGGLDPHTPVNMTIDPSPFMINLIYTFRPSAVPEPTLFGVTGGILGLLIWRVRRKRGKANTGSFGTCHN